MKVFVRREMRLDASTSQAWALYVKEQWFSPARYVRTIYKNDNDCGQFQAALSLAAAAARENGKCVVL